MAERSSPRQFRSIEDAVSEALDGAEVARDVAVVLVAALRHEGEGYGPPLLSALGTVAQIGEEHATRAFTAAGAALDMLRT